MMINFLFAKVQICVIQIQVLSFWFMLIFSKKPSKQRSEKGMKFIKEIIRSHTDLVKTEEKQLHQNNNLKSTVSIDKTNHRSALQQKSGKDTNEKQAFEQENPQYKTETKGILSPYQGSPTTKPVKIINSYHDLVYSSKQTIRQERQMYQKIKALQKQLHSEQEKIKKLRLQFISHRQLYRRRVECYEKQSISVDEKTANLQQLIEIDVQDSKNDEELRSHLMQAIGKLNQEYDQMLRLNKDTYDERISEINKVRQKNSQISRQIYEKKTKLQRKMEQIQAINQKRKQVVNVKHRAIETENSISAIEKTKQSLKLQKKSQFYSELIEQLQSEPKKPIYQRIEQELNLVKEYFKISSNHKEFIQSIRSMKLGSFQKQVKKVQQRRPQIIREILPLYEKYLWDVESSLSDKVLQSNRKNSYSQPEHISHLKSLGKELQVRKNSLNQHLRDQEKTIDSLSAKMQELKEELKNANSQREGEYSIAESIQFQDTDNHDRAVGYSDDSYEDGEDSHGALEDINFMVKTN